MPHLHVKLEVMKKIFKAVNKTFITFQHLKTIFPKVSNLKLEEKIFVDPQIRPISPDKQQISTIKKGTNTSQVQVCFLTWLDH